MSQLSGTGVLAELAVRTDRVRIPAWTVAVAGLTVLIASSYSTIYPTAESRQARAELISSPAATALAGPGYGLDDYTLGAMVANEIAGMTMVAVAIMSVLLVTRHLRTEEETGRAELVRAGVVGRYAGITAGLVSAALANVFVALLLVIGLLAVGLPPAGSLNMSAGVLVVGLVFTSLSALASQLTEHARAASGAGICAVVVAYLLRAVGDVQQGHSGSLLTWVSPIGWSQATRAYVDERWWPLLIGVVAAALTVVCAYAAIGRRDVGAGLLPPRGGRAEASPRLTGVTALAARQQRGQILAWGVGVFALSLPIGSLGRQISDFIEQDPDLAQLLPGGAAAAADGAFALYLVFLVVMAAMYAVGAVVSIRSEESSGRAEEALATPVSRAQWLGGQLVVIAAAAVTIAVAAGVGMGITAAFTLSDAGALGRLIGAALNTVPAVLVIVGSCAAVYGLIPRALPALWAFVGYVLVAGMFGEVLPDWFGILSPFHYTPALPAESFSAAPLVVLLLLAAALFLAAVAGFRRRDVGP